METHLADFIRDTPTGREAAQILRSCVHCGFCNANCPTYQLTGDELDGPRGRIYLIKQLLEGADATARTRLHLDRCLTCRSCETTCPSGVRYSRLADIGREVLAGRLLRRQPDALMRMALKAVLPRPLLFGTLMKLGQMVRLVMPKALRDKLPPITSAGVTPRAVHARQMIVLAGCAQPSMYPNINGAARRVLSALGITLLAAPRAGCCGALRFHLDDVAGARADARRNIDAWWPLIDAGAEAIVITASGCGVQVKDYAHLLHDDADYRAKAARVAALARDVSEIIAAESPALVGRLAQRPELPANERRVAFHSPCTLQHGQQLRGVIEPLLQAAGYTLVTVADAHLCCGSAGTYSILQPELSGMLRNNKLAALTRGEPVIIASANVGCIAHLAGDSPVPVQHWIELIDARLSN